jgi:heme-degrading monooxygenase HmoA
MIIRVFRYQLRAGTRDAFESVIRTDGFPALRLRPGIRLAYAARHQANPDAGVVVTGWETFDDLFAVVGRRLDRPTFLPGTFEFAEDREVSHWEALDLPAIGSVDKPAVLRLLFGHVDPRFESSYFDWVRHDVWPRLASTEGHGGAWVGRQLESARDEPVLAVSVWSSIEAISAAAGDVRVPLFTGHGASGFEVERVALFDIIDRIDPRRAIDENQAATG